MSQFKPGDVVECITGTDPGKGLVAGQRYTIAGNSSRSMEPHVTLVENAGEWRAARFKLAEVEVKTAKACTCSTNQLFWGGCICGMFKVEQAVSAIR